MGDLKIIEQGGLLGVIHSPNKFVSLGKPFSKEIFLIDVVVAGTTHIENIRDLKPKLGIDTRVRFFRESENEADPFAIVIKNDENEKIGYIPRKQNEIMARLLDGGKLLYGVIREKAFVGDWLKIRLNVFLDD